MAKGHGPGKVPLNGCSRSRILPWEVCKCGTVIQLDWSVKWAAWLLVSNWLTVNFLVTREQQATCVLFGECLQCSQTDNYAFKYCTWKVTEYALAESWKTVRFGVFWPSRVLESSVEMSVQILYAFRQCIVYVVKLDNCSRNASCTTGSFSPAAISFLWRLNYRISCRTFCFMRSKFIKWFAAFALQYYYFHSKIFSSQHIQ